MKLFSSAETDTTMDPTSDPDVIAAQQALVTAQQRKAEAEQHERRAWDDENRGGVNPPPDSHYWPLRAQANEARRVHQQAAETHHRVLAEARSRAQGVLEARVDEWVEGCERDLDPVLLDHAERLGELQRLAERGALRFDQNALLSLPHVLSVQAVDEWRAAARKHFRQ